MNALENRVWNMARHEMEAAWLRDDWETLSFHKIDEASDV
jgi:hypothetical protein